MLVTKVFSLMKISFTMTSHRFVPGIVYPVLVFLEVHHEEEMLFTLVDSLPRAGDIVAHSLHKLFIFSYMFHVMLWK